MILLILIVPDLDSRCLLQPYKAGELVKFKKSATLGEQVILSSEEERCNPLFAKS